MILLLDWDSDKLRAHFLFRDVSMPFSKLGLSAPITDAVTALGYEKPTSIQQKAIPIVLRGSNLIAAAQTGTGKTASFVLPILEKLSQGETQRKKRARAIILTPTRELALQVHQSIEAYGKNLPLRSMAMFGGVEYAPQKQALIEGVDIVVSTPGRLIDLYGQRAIHFDEVEMLVLDEADKMLDMALSTRSIRSSIACQKMFKACCSRLRCRTQFVIWPKTRLLILKRLRLQNTAHLSRTSSSGSPPSIKT